MGSGILRNQFSRLYHLSVTKNCRINTMRAWVEGVWEWRWAWRRGLLERDMNLFSQFLNVINRYNLRQDVKDKWIWKANVDGSFNTKSAYQLLRVRTEAGNELNHIGEACTLIWNKLSPIKVSVMTWRLLQDRLPTKLNLVKRRVELSTEERQCCLCKAQEEDAAHLFFLCPVTFEIWRTCYSWLGVPMVIHQNIIGNFLMHSGLFKGKRGKTLSMCIWECIVWVIWKARNNVIFNDIAFNSEKVLEEVKGRVWSWCLIKNFFNCNSEWNQWLFDPRGLF